MSEELKPCPFCGSEVTIRYVRGFGMDTGNWIGCNNCGHSYMWADESGIEIWNTRPLEDSLRKQLEECKRLMGEQGMETIHQSSRRFYIEKQLAIAVEALEKIRGYGHGDEYEWACDALAEIERIRTGSQDKPDNGA